MNKINLAPAIFNEKKIRRIWQDDEEKWYFSIVDMVEALTESSIPRRYWSDLKNKLILEGSEVYEKIVQLNMLAEESTTEISKVKEPSNFPENRQVASEGGHVAGVARKEIENKTGKSVISRQKLLS